MLGGVEAPCADVLETVFFEAADLFRGGQTLGAAFVEPVEQEAGFAGRFHRVGQDAELFEGGGLLRTGRCGLPAEGGYIAGQIFGLNAHFVLQRVNEPGFFPPLFFQLPGKGFFPLGDDVLPGLLRGFRDVFGAAGLRQILGHLPRHGAVFADQIGRAAELVPVGHPEEIEQQQVAFARGKPGAAADHLAVQAADFGGAEDHHAIDGRTIPALGEQHRVAEDVVFSGVEIGQYLLSVVALAVDLGGGEADCVEQIPELLARLDEGQKDDGLAAFAVGLHLGGDLGEVRVESRSQLAHGIVAAAESHARDVQLEGDGLGEDPAQVALSDGVGQLVLIGQRVEHLPKVPHIAAVGRGRHAEDFCTLKVIEDAAVAVGDGVVGFVDDDGAEVVSGKPFQPGRTLQGLDRAHRDPKPAVEAGGFGLFYGTDQTGRAFQFVRSLFQQLAPMGEDEHPVAGAHLIGGDGGEHDGLAGAGRQHQQGAEPPAFPFGVNGIPRLLLVGAE